MYCEFILSDFPQRAILIKFVTPPPFKCYDYECVELCLYVLKQWNGKGI